MRTVKAAVIRPLPPDRHWDTDMDMVFDSKAFCLPGPAMAIIGSKGAILCRF